MDRRVEYALVVIQTNPPGSVAVAQVARNLGLSPSRLEHLIKQETGRAFKEHVQYVRLSAAPALLRNPRLSIKEIAIDRGYKNPANFTRAFKAFFGESPLHFRRRHPIAGQDNFQPVTLRNSIS